MKFFTFISIFVVAFTNLYAQTNLEYLNEKRVKAGMITFTENNLLNQAAQNHANYVKTNIYTTGYESHYESSGNIGYTGYAPWNRGYYVGYKTSASENMTVGYDNYNKSIDGLFTAIYHRFGFLNFSIDEIGFGESLNSEKSPLYTHVYNMGNSKLNALCNGTSYNGYGSYVYAVCSDKTLKIETNIYNSAVDENAQQNPDIVVWPYENQQDFQTVFFEESPDPLPTCSVTGNPISIEFNPTTTGNISMTSFKLYDSNNTEITDLTLLNKATDPNAEFTDKEFAIFPMQRLDFGQTYTTEFSYTEDGIAKTKSWSFKTKSLKYDYYKITQNSTTLQMMSGKTYMLYIPPSNCNDSRLNFTYRYTTSSKPILEIVDANLLKVTLSGNIGQYVEITLANGKVIKAVLSSSDSAITAYVDDNDGIPYAYEIANGLDPTRDDSLLDLDDDGRTNIAEYQDGTNPNDANSKIFTIELNQGWNLVALPLNSSVDIDTLNNANLKVVRSFQNDKWYVWTDKNASTSEKHLTALEDGYGYWIKVSQNTTLNILGNGVANLQAIQANKWHIVGSVSVENIALFFHNNPKVTTLWKYSNGEWLGISRDGDIQQTMNDANISQLNKILPNEGFMYK